MDQTSTNSYRKSFLRGFVQRIYGSPFLQQRRFITFFIFLILSAAFWFIRSLSEEYETQIQYPVRYINFPEDKVLVGNVPYKLLLTVKAKGFNIFKTKLKVDLLPLRFNVSSFSLNSLGTDTFYIDTRTVKEVLSAELAGMTILDIAPDTLFFKLTNISVKKVPVLPVLALHSKFFLPEFTLNGNVGVSPDSIIISGPKPIVDSIKYISTRAVKYSNLSDTVIDEAALKKIHLITFSQPEVKITIPVDRFTEVENQLAVVPINVPDSLNMIAIPGQVTITYRVCLSNYNRVVNSPLVPRIDYTQINEQKNRLSVFLADTPQYISNLRFNPKVTEYLITRE